ncbi:ABC transporter ATP-binding protein [Nocardia sp. alder85J]|uniref:ABC transporter ATP-binding protein n=1 Tax=Nocardia sp. alder85J TaxID=2862949 RepID=UPI001CD1F303|nr:ABC transporter ATP-binding protein [Nocardia sp. alder85J]MCX4098214.1 ABC transporter ATP-binding protein [Nocardia sp. alder85J]
MATFDVRGLGKLFPTDPPVRALDGIDLTIEEGEFVVFLGPSGCGKSTLLEILAGLQEPTEGEVLLAGEPVRGTDPRIGVVFQDASLYPWRTVARNVEIGLEFRGAGKAQRREAAAKYLAQVGLSGFEKKYPHQLSGGMRQRAGIARTLAAEPDVLLMDEPFGAVDHLTRIQLQRDLLALWESRRRTVVFVTHDVGEAVYLADRVILLSPRPGRIAREFVIDEPRPRQRGDIGLLAEESEIYDTLSRIEQPSGA